MDKQRVTFDSSGLQLAADLYLPDEAEGSPVVVMAGGWCYVKELVQPAFAEVFTGRGFAALVFDYRNCGESEGAPRQEINPWDQMEDYKNAISYATTIDGVDGERIGIWGISYSGGHVVQLAATEPRVKAMASVVPVIDGYENMRLAHGTLGMRELVEAVRQDRAQRWLGNEPGMLEHNPSERGALSTWPFPTSKDMFEVLKPEAPNYQGQATARSTEWLLEYNVRPYAERILDTPSLFVLAEGDDHTHWDLALDAFSAIPTPDRRLEIIRQSSHQTIYRDQRRRLQAATLCADWFESTL